MSGNGRRGRGVEGGHPRESFLWRVVEVVCLGDGGVRKERDDLRSQGGFSLFSTNPIVRIGHKERYAQLTNYTGGISRERNRSIPTTIYPQLRTA